MNADALLDVRQMYRLVTQSARLVKMYLLALPCKMDCSRPVCIRCMENGCTTNVVMQLVHTVSHQAHPRHSYSCSIHYWEWSNTTAVFTELKCCKNSDVGVMEFILHEPLTWTQYCSGEKHRLYIHCQYTMTVFTHCKKKRRHFLP